jgi:hypothetical protein
MDLERRMKNAFSFYKIRTVMLPLLIVFLPCQAFSEEIVLIASQDTSITEHSQAGGVDSNHGGDPVIQAIGSATFRSFPMFKFDLSELAGSVVTGDAVFSIYLQVVHPKQETVQKNISLYAWSSLDWEENTITFQQVEFPASPTSRPSDLAQPKLDTVTINITNRESYISFTIPRAIVQGWIDDAASNHGLALVNELFDVGNDVVFSANGLAKGTEPTLSFSIN